MALVTRSSTPLPKNATAYAVAGHRATTLSIAAVPPIPGPFDGREGIRVSCLSEVEPLSDASPAAMLPHRRRAF